MISRPVTAPAKSTIADDGLIRISQQALIQLRHQASQLTLSLSKIRAQQSGTYLSSFRGRGMEFNESRIYQAGDDIRNMDWKVTARTGDAHCKVFSEERERPVLCWTDFRESMQFATHGCFKSVVAAKTAANIAWAANAQGDRLGGLVFSEKLHHELKPQRGKASVLHFIKQLETIQQENKAENNGEHKNEHNTEHALSRLRRVTKPGSLIFLISDFRNLGEQSHAHIMQLARHNDIVMFFIYDRLERELPNTGHYSIQHQDKKIGFNSDKTQQQRYQAIFLQRLESLKTFARKHRISFIECSTEDNPLTQLKNSFL